MDIPDDHPRKQSLLYRKAIEEGVVDGIVASAGPIAHGRGEAFDYLLGEQTPFVSMSAITTAAAMLFLAKHPVISVNGNAAVLVPRELVALSNAIPAPLEINIFYGRTEDREQKIAKVLYDAGATKVLGVNPSEKIPLLTSARARVDKDGMAKADVVLVMLEDGDRTEYLVQAGKKVIAVDLNPLSRTPQKASLAIVDNIVRCIPMLTEVVIQLRQSTTPELQALVDAWDNKSYLQSVLHFIADRLHATELQHVE